MMGLMGNVAEVDYLRPHLMLSQYVSIFRSVMYSIDQEFSTWAFIIQWNL